MAKVKCDYCEAFFDDKLERCPDCGSLNSAYRKTTNGKPQTIEQLQDWYRARNLPPEHITRFFIGKNIKEPKAFGIYKEGDMFIVYKNKDTGQRAIRYQGTDEAYAVNELYLRLKEEILHQKKRNNDKRSNKTQYNNKPWTKRRNFSWVSVVFVVLFLSMILVPLTQYMIEEEKEVKSGDYYLDENKNLYFCTYATLNDYEWWLYNEEKDIWELYIITDSKYPINDMTNKKNKYDFISDVREVYAPDMSAEEFHDKYYIYDSKEFIDAGHHYEPREGYYKTGDDVYYYLDDTYGNSYGTRDNTGWYKYANSGWEYYCDYEDREKVGDDLWYSEDDYRIGSSYDTIEIDSYDFQNNQWNFTSFEDTEWYEEAVSAEKAFDRYQEEHKNDHNNWDDDNDWDWDSNDNWDSNDTDWGSDW